MFKPSKFFSALSILLYANYAPLANAGLPSAVTVSVYDNEAEKRPYFKGTFEGKVVNCAGFIMFMLRQEVFSMRENQFLLATCDRVMGGRNDKAKVVCARAGNKIACQEVKNDILVTWEKVSKTARRAMSGEMVGQKKKTEPKVPEEYQVPTQKARRVLSL